jgi:tetratricopeptide (TPR) repeat protein/CHAT domain-containing protein
LYLKGASAVRGKQIFILFLVMLFSLITITAPKAAEYKSALEYRAPRTPDDYTGILKNFTNQGDACFALGDYAKAREYYELALNGNLALFGEEDADTSMLLNTLGDIYTRLGDYAKAKAHLERSLAISTKIWGEGHPYTASSFNNLGSLHTELGDYAKAKEYFERSLALFLKNFGENHPDTVSTINNLGSLYIETGDNVKAKEYHERALAARVKLFGEKHPKTANSLNNLGLTYSRLGDYTKAEQYYKQALAVKLEMSGEHPETANSLDNLGSLYAERGDYVRAKEHHERALTIFLKFFGEENEHTAESISSLGSFFLTLGDHIKAKEHYERALAIRVKIFGEEHVRTADSLNNLGRVYFTFGNHAKAKEYYEHALEIKLKILGVNHPKVGNSFNNLGGMYEKLGEYAQAKENYERALMIHLKNSGEEHPDVADVFHNLGGIYIDLGDYEKAIEYYGRALTIREKLFGKEHADTVGSLGSLGGVYLDLGEYAKAKEYYARALATQLKIFGEEHADVASFLNNMGLTCIGLKDYAEAEEYLKRALAIRQNIFGGNHADIAASLGNLGILYSYLGDYLKAKGYYEHALIIYLNTQEGMQSINVASPLYNLGHCYEFMGSKEAATFYKKLAVNRIQSTRARITNLEKSLQKSFIQSRDFLYHDLVDLLVEQGRIAEAQQVLAMLKEEEFFDFIRRDAQTDPRITAASYTDLEKDEVERFQEIAKQLFTLNKEREELLKKRKFVSDGEWNSSDDAKRLTAIRDDLSLVNEVFQKFLAALETKLKSNEGHEDEIAALKNLEAIKNNLHEMGHGAVLIHTIAVPERVWLLLTTPDFQLAIESPIPREELFKKILTFRECLENRGDVLPVAKELYDVLVAPVAEDLEKAGARTLMFSLDGALRYIPIAALHDGEKWLAEKYAVTVYTEAARNNLKAERAANEWRVAGMGVTKAYPEFSALPNVRFELESIIRRGNAGEEIFGLPGTIRLDEEFTESTFADALDEGTPVVHIASHFRFNPGTIVDSFLLLGDGAHLTLEDINYKDFRFGRVDLLTLSACDTAMGTGRDGGAGREVEGLGVLAQTRGTKSVMATLWRIADESTGVFMSRFYTLLQQEGMTKAEALRQAQVEFIEGKTGDGAKGESGSKRNRGRMLDADTRDDKEALSSLPPNYRHPYFWAPFILMGNWL